VTRKNGRQAGHELDAPPWSRVEGTLLTTARAMRQAYDRCMSHIGVNLTEASVLAHLGDGGPLTQVELARRIGTSRGHIGVQIDALEARGALERRPDPSDRRVWNVTLTPAGQELWRKTIEVDQYVRKVLRAGTSADDRRRLDNLLEIIHRNANAVNADEITAAGQTSET
jgi:MarR family transcriptional regulator, transcriptional regulator for hemolysin